MSRDPQSGITLVEMLVAVALTALIGVAGYTMLDAILRVERTAGIEIDRLAELDRAFIVLGRDLLEARTGEIAIEDEALILSPDRAIVLSDARLTRRLGHPPVDQILATAVEAISWRILDTAREWHDAWPPDDPLPPVAAEATLALGGVDVTRLFLLTPGVLP